MVSGGEDASAIIHELRKRLDLYIRYEIQWPVGAVGIRPLETEQPNHVVNREIGNRSGEIELVTDGGMRIVTPVGRIDVDPRQLVGLEDIHEGIDGE